MNIDPLDPDVGIYYALLKAWREMTWGMLSAAKSTLAEAVETSLKVETERDVLNDEQAVVLALSLQIDLDLAMVRTGAAQRAYNSLKTRERMGILSRNLFHTQQAGRMFLAATGRLSEALAGVDEEALSSEDRSASAIQRVALSVRAASLHEVVRYAAAWIPEQRSEAKQRAEERRRTRDENPPALAAQDSSAIEELLLLAAIEVARAQLSPLLRGFFLFRARRRATSAVEIATQGNHPVLKLEGELLLGQIASLRGHWKEATAILKKTRITAAEYGHRDLESRIALRLAESFRGLREMEQARLHAQESVALATSTDGGPPLQPVIDSAFSILLEADALRRPSVAMMATSSATSEVEPRPETVILIHGTYAGPMSGRRQWYERGSEFCSGLNAQLAALQSPARCWAHLPEGEREFFWSGANSWVDRSAAAASLAAYLATLTPRWRCRLVAHSHGGNVCHEALDRLDERGLQPPWDGKLVTMGTPFFHRWIVRTRPRFPWMGMALRAAAALVVIASTVWAAVTLPPWEVLLGLLVAILLPLECVVIGYIFLIARGGWLEVFNRDRIDRWKWPRALAISSEQDEALKIIRLALEELDPPQLRNRKPVLALARILWRESIHLARARKKRVSVRPLQFAKAFVLELARYRLLRLAWRSMREQICGLIGLEGGLDFLRVNPRPAVDGKPVPGRYEQLPADLVAEALEERKHDITGLSIPILDFLETERWSTADVETLLRGTTIGKLVHSFYYRNPRCIRRIARWLAVPVPESKETKEMADIESILAAMNLAEAVKLNRFGEPWAMPDPWADREMQDTSV
jgi:hypothetical protein